MELTSPRLSPEKMVPEHQAKKRLLDAASHLFIEKGYAAASVNEIVEAAGVTKPMLYYYFKSKEAIYLAILQEAVDSFNAVLSEHDETEGPVLEHVVDLAGRIHVLFMEKLNVARLINARKFGPPHAAPAFDMGAVEASFLGTFQRLVQRGLDSGEFQGELPDILMAIGSIIDSCLMAEINCCGGEMKPGRDGMQRQLRLLHRGIAGTAENNGPKAQGSPEVKVNQS